MRAIVQRVTKASVTVEGEVIGAIEQGIMVLVGIKADDTPEDMAYIANKISGLRIFSDEDGKMNLSVKDIQGEMLIIPNFTLYGSAIKGMRPSFIASGDVEEARKKYDQFIEVLGKQDISFQTGRFQSDMQVELVNDGPVTILLDSSKLF